MKSLALSLLILLSIPCDTQAGMSTIVERALINAGIPVINPVSAIKINAPFVALGLISYASLSYLSHNLTTINFGISSYKATGQGEYLDSAQNNVNWARFNLFLGLVSLCGSCLIFQALNK